MKFLLSVGFWNLFVFCSLSFGICAQNPSLGKPVWPARYAGSYGFEIMADHDGTLIVSSVDSTSQAFKLGVSPGMQILGWNTLPVRRKLESMKVHRYRKTFPLLNDEKIRMLLLTRGRNGETAEVFFMTPTGNNRGLRLTAKIKE